MSRFHAFALLAFLTILLGVVACGRPDDRGDLFIFEEAPCPMELPASVRQGKDIVCGHVTVPEEHAHPEGETLRLAVAVLNDHRLKAGGFGRPLKVALRLKPAKDSCALGRKWVAVI